MTIAILADPLDNQRAGVHVYVRELVRALEKLDTRNEYVVVREKPDPKLSLRQISVPNLRLPGYPSFRLFTLIPRVLRRLGADVVFEPAHFGPFNLPDRMRRVTMIHDLTPIILPRFHLWHSQALQRVFLPGILRRADLVLSNSQNTTNDLARIYPFTAHKTRTLLLGRDEGMRRDQGDDFLREYGLTAPYFLYVGTIEPRKMLNRLLTAYESFRKRSANPAPLVIIGQRGWKSAHFYRALKRHPFRASIHLTGYVSHRFLRQAYTHALALVYPSFYEGFGFPVLEALSCGTHVICPDNSSLPEVGGHLPHYYPVDNPEALSNLMVLLSKRDKAHDEIITAGPRWAERFSWKDYAQRFDVAMRELR